MTKEKLSIDDRFYSYRGDDDEVMEWLKNNLGHEQLSLSGRSAGIKVDGRELVAWGLARDSKKVYIRRTEDAIFFKLKWS